MYKRLTFSDFRDEFTDYGRSDQFSYDGLKALYEYLEDFYESSGEEFELDVIALCCEFTEYDSIEDYLNDYSSNIDREDYDEEEEYYEAVLEDLYNHTTVIKISGTDGLIIQSY